METSRMCPRDPVKNMDLSEGPSKRIPRMRPRVLDEGSSKWLTKGSPDAIRHPPILESDKTIL